MKIYNLCLLALTSILIVIGLTQVFMIFFNIPLDESGKPISNTVVWAPELSLQDIMLALLLPIGLYIWRKKPAQADLLPDICLIVGVIEIMIQISNADGMSDLLFFSIDLVLGIGIFVSAMSFKRGNLHCQTRLIMLMQALIAVDIIKVAVLIYVGETQMNLTNIIFAVPEMTLFILVLIGIMPLCLYPKDFPGPRLSQQLKDLENSMTNKGEMFITQSDFDTITGRDMTGWRPSKNPMVESEVRVQIHGTKAKKFIKASKWKGEDGIFITFISMTDLTISLGTGSKVIYVADDTSRSSLKGKVVRFYTEDGFFYSLVVLDFDPVVKHKYRSKLSRFFEDF